MLKRLLLAALLLALPQAADAAPRVVASILPVQSIAASVMAGVGVPELLLKGGASPHAYSLRPSDAALLAEADMTLWVGPGLETFLAKPIEALGGAARALELADAPGVALLPIREGGDWEAHADAAGEGHGVHDMHLWLSTDNAAAMARSIADGLGAVDPGNASAYAANAAAFVEEMQALKARLAAELAPVAGRPYVVFHDAYQYFSREFGLNPVGSVTASPETPPGTARIAALRAKVEGLGAVCVFSEPQFEPRLVATLTEGTNAGTGTLDPLGDGLAPGPGRLRPHPRRHGRQPRHLPGPGGLERAGTTRFAPSLVWSGAAFAPSSHGGMTVVVP